MFGKMRPIRVFMKLLVPVPFPVIPRVKWPIIVILLIMKTGVRRVPRRLAEPLIVVYTKKCTEVHWDPVNSGNPIIG